MTWEMTKKVNGQTNRIFFNVRSLIWLMKKSKNKSRKKVKSKKYERREEQSSFELKHWSFCNYIKLWSFSFLQFSSENKFIFVCQREKVENVFVAIIASYRAYSVSLTLFCVRCSRYALLIVDRIASHVIWNKQPSLSSSLLQSIFTFLSSR